jgi:hypothetical protein
MKKLQLLFVCVLAVTSCNAQQDKPSNVKIEETEGYVRLVTDKSFGDLILEYKTIKNLTYAELAAELTECNCCYYIDGCPIEGGQLQNAVLGEKGDGISVKLRSALTVCLANKIKKAVN